MAQAEDLISIRVDEIPLVYSIIQELGISGAINGSKQVHGNWVGTNIGDLIELWLCYILSECDHRISSVEDWSSCRIELLRAMSGLEGVSSYDFSDDKLGLLLDYIGEEAMWQRVEKRINEKSLSIYRFEELGSMATFRLDAAPMQSHGRVEEGGLLQYGYSKHHADLPQFKLKLCTLDNELNHFAYPVTHLTVSGELSDDVLYEQILNQSKGVLSGIKGYETGNLYVGDNKFGSIRNRASVVNQSDYYLLPLSLVQLGQKEREEMIKQTPQSDYTVVELIEENKETVLIAEGFEKSESLDYQLDGTCIAWSERRLYVHSHAYANSSKKALDRRITAAIESITQLTERKQGKKVLHKEQEYQQAIDKILKEKELEDFLTVKIETKVLEKVIKAWGKRPERTDIELKFDIEVTKNEAAIEAHKLLLGWQVYATNAPIECLSYEKCVWKYRYQSNIESRFDDIRNKMAPLLPVFLQKDQRIKGLVNLLLLALKVCSVLEYKIAKALSEQKEELQQIYEGNPTRGSKRPSAKRLFLAFQGVSIALVFLDYKLKFALMTKLEPVQLKILKLLNIKPTVYENLAKNIQIFFSDNNITET